MVDNHREFMPEAGKILNRVHLEIKEGFVKHSYELDKKFTNRRDFIMGGFISTMLDGLCGHALHTLHDKDHVTLELKTIFLSPAKVGKFIGEGKVVKIGRSVGFSEAIIWDASINEIARASATFRIFNH
tara:strand:+ start:656 stop:1042 length:387 start_codon:yes stop_codon:yes gene_type:complete